MKNIGIGILAMSLTGLMACNNADTSVKAEEPVHRDTTITVQSTAADTTISGCYMMTVKRDTANFQIAVKGKNVMGPLSINNYEKDRNSGTFEGELNGDILMGWYLFKSEGMMSVRQVAWKVSGNSLWPATGEVRERNDSAMFVNPDKLQFDSTRALKKVRCMI